MSAEPLFGIWQPIETAPKDGTWVLAISTPEGRPLSLCHDSSAETFYDWMSDSFFSGGWTDYTNDGPPYHHTTRHEPTHWMPLPPNPVISSQASPPPQ